MWRSWRFFVEALERAWRTEMKEEVTQEPAVSKLAGEAELKSV